MEPIAEQRNETAEEKNEVQDLRLEAQPIAFSHLSLSQLEAARRVAVIIHGAYVQSNTKDIRENRRNHVVMVAGGKGSGKTTLTLSLRKWFENPSGFKGELHDSHLLAFKVDERKNYNKLGSSIEGHIEKSERAVVWLDSLSLDPLPPGTNLVAAIFARINEAVARRYERAEYFQRDRGLLEPVSVLDRALHEMGSLRSDAVMALEGNMVQRAPGMDPESYAISAIENEKKKLEVAKRLNSVLGRLVAGAKGHEDKEPHALFILPVDDLDSAPARAVEMLKLAYSLSIPRLLFLLLGSVDTADQTLFYQAQGEFRQLLRAEGQGDSELLKSVEVMANEIASSSLRKMVPPSQRIELAPLTIEHARRFQPAAIGSKGGQANLAERLKEIHLAGRTFYAESEEDSEIPLSSLLFASEPFPGSGGNSPHGVESQYLYDGLGLLRVAPRQLADLYSLASAHAVRRGAAREFILDLFQDTFRALVDEDGGLTPPVQRELKQCVQRDPFSGDLEMTPPHVHVVVEMGDRLEFGVNPFGISDGQLYPCARVGARRVLNLELEASVGAAECRRRFSPQTRSAFKVIHDLIRIDGAGVITVPIGSSGVRQIAFTEWNDGVNEPFNVPWLVTEWPTFWHWDFFLRVWNQGLSRIRLVCRERAAVKKGQFVHLLAGIAAAALVATAEAVVEARHAGGGDSAASKGTEGSSRTELRNAMEKFLVTGEPEDGKGWTFESLGFSALMKSVAERAVGLADHVQARRLDGWDDEQADQIDAALINLILLMAPESGIPSVSMDGSDEWAFASWFSSREKRVPTEAPEGLRKTHARPFWMHPYLQAELRPRIRQLRSERLGRHLSSLLGVALVSPGAAGEIAKGIKPRPEWLREGHFSIGEEYCPDRNDLRRVFLRLERTGESRSTAAEDLEAWRAYAKGRELECE